MCEQIFTLEVEVTQEGYDSLVRLATFYECTLEEYLSAMFRNALDVSISVAKEQGMTST